MKETLIHITIFLIVVGIIMSIYFLFYWLSANQGCYDNCLANSQLEYVERICKCREACAGGTK